MFGGIFSRVSGLRIIDVLRVDWGGGGGDGAAFSLVLEKDYGLSGESTATYTRSCHILAT